MIKKYMKKPEYIHALQYVENERESVFEFCGIKAEFIIPSNTKVLTLFVTCTLGPKKVNPGDYITKDSDGIFKIYSASAFNEEFFKVKEVEVH